MSQKGKEIPCLLQHRAHHPFSDTQKKGGLVPHLRRGLGTRCQLLVGAHVLPGGHEDAVGHEGAGGEGEPGSDVPRSLVQHGRGGVVAVVDVPPAARGVQVGQEGSDDGEVRGEIVVHVLGLPGEILGGDDPVGPHLWGEG